MNQEMFEITDRYFTTIEFTYPSAAVVWEASMTWLERVAKLLNKQVPGLMLSADPVVHWGEIGLFEEDHGTTANTVIVLSMREPRGTPLFALAGQCWGMEEKKAWQSAQKTHYDVMGARFFSWAEGKEVPFSIVESLRIGHEMSEVSSG